MDLKIRHVEPDDAEAVRAILTSENVLRGTMRLPYAPLDQVRQRIAPSDGTVTLVAEVAGEVVGFAELETYPQVPRHRHTGEIGMVAVRDDWCGKGIGRALATALVDMADKWLNLTRLSLIVWTTNKQAIGLYQKLGFEVEGTMPDYAVGEDGYTDAHVMGRIKRR